MSIIKNGTAHGKIIELDVDSGLPDGQKVSVTLQPQPTADNQREALERAFGGWSDDPEGLDEFVRQIYRERDSATRPGVED